MLPHSRCSHDLRKDRDPRIVAGRGIAESLESQSKTSRTSRAGEGSRRQAQGLIADSGGRKSESDPSASWPTSDRRRRDRGLADGRFSEGRRQRDDHGSSGPTNKIVDEIEIPQKTCRTSRLLHTVRYPSRRAGSDRRQQSSQGQRQRPTINYAAGGFLTPRPRKKDPGERIFSLLR